MLRSLTIPMLALALLAALLFSVNSTTATAQSNGGSIRIAVNTGIPHSQTFDWTLTRSGGGFDAAFTLRDFPQEPGPPDQFIADNLPPGTYNLQLSALPDGWQVSFFECLGSSENSIDTVNISATLLLEENDIVACTLNVFIPATLRIAKAVSGSIEGDPPSFLFFGDLDNFSLEPGEVFTASDLTPGAYEVVEIPEFVNGNWEVDNILCDDPSGDSEVDVDSASIVAMLGHGETVTCTFVNQDTTAFLTLIKETIVDGNQPFPTDEQFFFDVCCATSDVVDTDPDTPTPDRTTMEIPPGTHFVFESNEDISNLRWEINAISCDGSPVDPLFFQITLTAGQHMTCTVLNEGFSETPYGAAPLTIIKVVSPTTGLITETFDFQIFDNDSDSEVDYSNQFTLDVDESSPLSAAYPNSVTLNGIPTNFIGIDELLPEGWRMTDYECSRPNFQTGTPSFPRIFVELDSLIITDCIFTNTHSISATVTVIKEYEELPPPESEIDFLLTDSESDFHVETLPTEAPFQVVFTDVLPGLIDLEEDAADIFELTEIECSSDVPEHTSLVVSTNITDSVVRLDLLDGENAVCTFTNRINGGISIEKRATDYLGAAELDSGARFSYTMQGPQLFEFDLAPSEVAEFQELEDGAAYVVEEEELGGWELMSIFCEDHLDQPVSDITVDLAARTLSFQADEERLIECTFVNRQLPPTSITVAKVTSATTDAPFAFRLQGAFVDADFNLAENSPISLTDEIRFAPLTPGGSYSVTEEATPDTALLSIDCVDQGTGGQAGVVELPARHADVPIDEDAHIHCTFTNSLIITPSITITKETSTPEIEAGDDVPFTITVVNDGSVPLVDVSTSDPAVPACSQSYTDNGGVLAPQAIWSYTCSALDVTADFTNTISVTSTEQGEGGVVQVAQVGEVVATASVFVNVLPSAAAIEASEPVSVTSGSAVTCAVSIRNDSAEPIFLTALTRTVEVSQQTASLAAPASPQQANALCSTPQTIGPGLIYACEYSATVSGPTGAVAACVFEALLTDDDGGATELTGSSLQFNILAPTAIEPGEQPAADLPQGIFFPFIRR